MIIRIIITLVSQHYLILLSILPTNTTTTSTTNKGKEESIEKKFGLYDIQESIQLPTTIFLNK